MPFEPSFRYALGLLVRQPSHFLAVQESKDFFSDQAVDPFQHLDGAYFWRFVWAFSNFSFYFGSKE